MTVPIGAGQINRGSLAGDFIYETSQNENNKIFVEIGSWNGRGSTKCVMDALVDRFDECILYSLEASKPFFESGREYWRHRLQSYNSIIQGRLKLIHGRIMEASDMLSIDEIMKDPMAKPEWRRFYANDLESFKTCENVENLLPETIDVLILDGGEFTTEIEYQKLKDRSRIIICDDSSMYKCDKIRKELIEDTNFVTLIDEPKARNGFCAFERVK
jgi:hypothetical protein